MGDCPKHEEHDGWTGAARSLVGVGLVVLTWCGLTVLTAWAAEPILKPRLLDGSAGPYALVVMLLPIALTTAAVLAVNGRRLRIAALWTPRK